MGDTNQKKVSLKSRQAHLFKVTQGCLWPRLVLEQEALKGLPQGLTSGFNETHAIPPTQAASSLSSLEAIRPFPQPLGRRHVPAAALVDGPYQDSRSTQGAHDQEDLDVWRQASRAAEEPFFEG